MASKDRFCGEKGMLFLSGKRKDVFLQFVAEEVKELFNLDSTSFVPFEKQRQL